MKLLLIVRIILPLSYQMPPHIFPLGGPQATVITMQMIAGLNFRFPKQISYRSIKNVLCRLHRYKYCIHNTLFLTAAHFSSLCVDPGSFRVTDRHTLDTHSAAVGDATLLDPEFVSTLSFCSAHDIIN